jgi:hypothetical protein
MFMSPLSSPFKSQLTDHELLSTPPGIPITSPAKYVKSMIDLGSNSPGNDDMPLKAMRKSSLEIATEQAERQDELPPIAEEGEIEQAQGKQTAPEKVKTWPVFKGERLQAENDRMFRDIIFSPNLKEKIPLPPQRKSDKSMKEEPHSDEGEVHNILLQKMLDNN